MANGIIEVEHDLEFTPVSLAVFPTQLDDQGGTASFSHHLEKHHS